MTDEINLIREVAKSLESQEVKALVKELPHMKKVDIKVEIQKI